MPRSTKRKPNYTDTLAKAHGGKWKFFANTRRWVCDDNRRYVSCMTNLVDENGPPTYHLYGDGKPRIVDGPVIVAEVEEPETV